MVSLYELTIRMGEKNQTNFIILDDPVKGSKHVAFTSYAIKTNVDTIVFILFYYC
jgi:hypothetical protein